MTQNLRRRRVARLSLVAGLAFLVVLTALVAALRRDRRHVFLDTRASIAAARVVESWTTGDSRVERLRFLDAEGEVVSRVLVRSPRDPGGVRRSLVVYAGKQTGDLILELIPERGDLILVAPLYPELDPDGLVESLALPAAIRRSVFTTVAGGMAALARLDEKEVRRGQTVVLAASFGSAFGTIHAALDDRADELVVVHGGGEFPLVLRHIYQRRGKAFVAAVLPWLAEAFLDSFDPVHWIGDVSPRPVLLIATRRDKYFPVASIEALHAAAGEPKHLLWTETDHVGASKTEIVEAIVAEIEAYLEATTGEQDPGDPPRLPPTAPTRPGQSPGAAARQR